MQCSTESFSCARPWAQDIASLLQWLQLALQNHWWGFPEAPLAVSEVTKWSRNTNWFPSSQGPQCWLISGCKWPHVPTASEWFQFLSRVLLLSRTYMQLCLQPVFLHNKYEQQNQLNTEAEKERNKTTVVLQPTLRLSSRLRAFTPQRKSCSLRSSARTHFNTSKSALHSWCLYYQLEQPQLTLEDAELSSGRCRKHIQCSLQPLTIFMFFVPRKCEKNTNAQQMHSVRSPQIFSHWTHL